MILKERASIEGWDPLVEFSKSDSLDMISSCLPSGKQLDCDGEC